MARKVDPSKHDAAPPPSGADDLAVLYPDVTITIAGREVTVREYGFVEGLRVRGWMRPFSEDLDKLFQTGEALVEDIMDVMAQHIDLVHRAIAQSIAPAGKPMRDSDVAWIASLGDADGDLLINAWWGVCGLFFVRQVMRRAAERARRAALAGATSTTRSSPPATDAPSGSADTPSASSSSSTVG